MGDTFVISGLKRKRARLEGEIRALQRALGQRQEERAMIDAVLLMFAPDCNPDMIPPIRPGSHGLFFGYRELPRLCLDVLRKAGKPVALGAIVEWIIAAKGLTLDGRLRKHVTGTTRAALIRLERRGVVRRVLVEPDTWWELVR